QRRHQKLIEEAPPPGLEPALLARLATAAVRLAREVGYAGLGTVEFLVAGADAHLLEMNPRLQVEHGITEAITGLDLVQLQIRIARGESLADLQVSERGVAIEARVCAEDPDASDALVAAAILAYQRRRRDARLNFFADTTNVSPVRVPPSVGQEVDLSFGGVGYRLAVFALGSWRYRVYLDGRAVTVTLR